ncbi:MAG: hypothetical protein WD049_10105 [Candidatus Paceibacterota bacterium]
MQQRDWCTGEQRDAIRRLLDELHKVTWFEVCDWESLSEERFEEIRVMLEKVCPHLQGREYDYADAGR